MTTLRWNCDGVQGCYLQQRWDPVLLDGCLPPGPGFMRSSSFGDMDAWAEINGWFLYIEHKFPWASWPSGGQHAALLNLARVPCNTVWLISGLPEGDYQWGQVYPSGSAPFRAISLDDLREYASQWGSWAAGAPPGLGKTGSGCSFRVEGRG